MSTRFLQGQGFYFRELQHNDLNGNWYSWFNDQQITEFQKKKFFLILMKNRRNIMTI